MTEKPPKLEVRWHHLWKRFTLLDVMYVVVILGSFLALVLQLGHIGFGVFCFVAQFILGLWQSKPRLLLASGMGLCIFVIVYVASWVQLGDKRTHLRWIENDLRSIAEAIEEFHAKHGTYPQSLDQLANYASTIANMTDHWGNAYSYEQEGATYRLICFGRDQVEGGKGLDGDISLKHGRLSSPDRVTFRQFLYEWSGSGGVFLSAFLSALLGGASCNDIANKPGMRLITRIGSYACTMLATIVVACFLAAFHVASSQSGH